MGWVSVTFVHKFVALVSGNGPERTRLLGSVGVNSEGAVDPRQMIPDTDFFELLEHLAADVPRGREFAVRVGASMCCDEYGAFGLAFKSATDLAGSYRRVERFGRVITSVANFRVMSGAENTFMEVIPAPNSRLGLQMTNELALAAATALSREVSRDAFTPVAVHIAHAAPDDDSCFRSHFGCPVHFEADRDAIEVSAEMLAKPNRLGDAGISRFFESHLDNALSELPEAAGLQQRVRTEIAQALSEGVPKLSRIAQHIGMSERTLQRRLAGSGQTYQTLVEHAQRDLASRLLRTTEHSIAEVAFLTGFTEQSTFSRAFKRWVGQTPRAHRLRN